MENNEPIILENPPNSDNAALIALYQGLNELLSAHDARIVAALEILNAKIDSVETEIYRQAQERLNGDSEIKDAIEESHDDLVDTIEEAEEAEEEYAAIETVIIQESPTVETPSIEEKAPRKRFFI